MPEQDAQETVPMALYIHLKEDVDRTPCQVILRLVCNSVGFYCSEMLSVGSVSFCSRLISWSMMNQSLLSLHDTKLVDIVAFHPARLFFSAGKSSDRTLSGPPETPGARVQSARS